MKLDDDTKHVMKLLIEDGVFNTETRGLDISKFLDEDNKLDLWFFEVAIRYSVKFLRHLKQSDNFILYTDNVAGYLSKRGLNYTSSKSIEELDFIQNFKNSIILDELSPGE